MDIELLVSQISKITLRPYPEEQCPAVDPGLHIALVVGFQCTEYRFRGLLVIVIHPEFEFQHDITRWNNPY